MVSGVSVQCGHESVGDFVMQCRCLLRGQWPIRNHVSTDVCWWFSSLVSLRNESEGSRGSVHVMVSYCGDSASFLIHRFLFVCFWCCNMAEMLSGRGLSQRSAGRWGVSLLYIGPSDAFLASPSAFSLPLIPLCPGIHLTVMLRDHR